jgi:hypothetical protein
VVVRADAPEIACTIESEPVTDLRPVPDRGLVLFADFTNLACYDAEGPVWRSDRLVYDEFRIDDVDGERGVIHARGFNAPARDRDRPFVIDLATGASADAPYF